MDNERRQYKRVSFDTNAKLTKGDQSFDCKIVDLSIHGVLLRPHGVIRPTETANYQLEIPLSADDNSIKMTLNLTHQHPDSLGFECKNIDLDSITHLRKIVELNSGDPTLLDRELDVLIKSQE